jgi:hypothetical protein
LSALKCGLLLLAFVQTVFSQGLPAGTFRTKSASAQFTICALPSATPASWISNFETNQDYARLVGTLLPVSCERIKQLLWRQLGESGPWRGRIFVVLAPAASPDQVITITSDQFRDAWQYRVELPDFVERSRYVRAIVQVLLLELANRTAAGHSAEIPPWLLEGLAQQLLISSSKDEIILPPPRAASDNQRPASTYTYVNARFENPLRQAHKELTIITPLSFQELSWPGPDQLDGPANGLYRDSAQLFVARLMTLKNGRSCLHQMIGELAQNYNWQFAFLRAFNSYFPRPLDVEKWWALQVVHFTGRDLTQSWPPEESWKRLDDIVRSQIQVRVSTNELPLRTTVSLQTIIQEWEPERQIAALEDKMRELELLQSRSAPILVPLIREYNRVLSAYLQNRSARSAKKAVPRHLVQQTLQELNALDLQRVSVKPATPSKPAQPPAEASLTSSPAPPGL